MRDFDWFDDLWCVVKNNGSFAGKPCVTPEEARELQAQHAESKIYELKYDNVNFEEEMPLVKFANLFRTNP